MPGIPSGTITFLFTDIESSTKLWEKHREAMQRAFKRQEQIIRDAVVRHNGYAYKMIGDAFQIAFATAPDALAAALDAQRALHTEHWGEVGALRVRMALHTGATEERRDDQGHLGDYVGPDLNRAARLLSAGHGGQILISDVTEGLLRDHLPANITLRDLGKHRLKDLTRPEYIYQVIAANLPSEFPPLKTLDSLPNNLPIQLTSFIGREREIAEIKRLWGNTRLLTLTGAGGCGKTRLAMQVAADLLDDFKDGVWLIELAPLSDPELIPQAMFSTLGLRDELGRPALDLLKDHLKDKTLLFLFDNCEHLIDACARVADALLRASLHIKILATSREALGIAGETAFRVPSLSLPDTKNLPPLESFTQYEAVHLFIDRVRAVQPSFQLMNANVPAVAQICQRLDGIPLAIELAATRLKAFSVEQVANRLDDRFHLLTGGSRTALPRQQTLRAAIDWSYALLSEKERVLFRRLAVFVGGWTLRAAEEICAGDGMDSIDVLDLMQHLVDKSLVMVEEPSGETRYRFLETIRQYAREKLFESGELQRVRDHHLEFFMKYAEEVEPKLHGPDQLVWLNRLEAEHSNLRSAMEWSKTGEVNLEKGFRLAGALRWFWHKRGYHNEGRKWLEQALKDHRVSDTVRAKALNGAAALAVTQGDLQHAAALASEGLALCQNLKDTAGLADALDVLGRAADYEGDYEQAKALLEESLSLYRQSNNHWGIAWELRWIAGVAYHQEDYTRAEQLLEESLTLFREFEDKRNLAMVLTALGRTLQRLGDYDRGRTLVMDGVVQIRSLNDKMGIETALITLVDILLDQGEYGQALPLIEESLSLSKELNDKEALSQIFLFYGEVALHQDKYERAARLFAAAEALREAINYQLPPADQKKFNRLISAARTYLEAATFNKAWNEGHAMTLEQVIEYARQEVTHE